MRLYSHFFLDTMFILFITSATGIDSVNWSMSILIWLSLLISGIGFPSDNKKWNIAAWVSTLMLTISSIAIGYNDYFQWASTKLCFGWLIFFTIIFIMKRFLDKQGIITKEI